MFHQKDLPNDPKITPKNTIRYIVIILNTLVRNIRTRSSETTVIEIAVAQSVATHDVNRLVGNPPDQRITNQTKGLVTARHPLATAVEAHTTPQIPSALSTGN